MKKTKQKPDVKRWVPRLIHQQVQAQRDRLALEAKKLRATIGELEEREQRYKASNESFANMRNEAERERTATAELYRLNRRELSHMITAVHRLIEMEHKIFEDKQRLQ